MKVRTFFITATTAIPLALFGFSAKAIPVDVELQLLVDVSGSVSGAEFTLQQQGYSDAFRSAAIKTAITTGGIHNSIAVQLIYWAGHTQQFIGVPWMEVNDVASADALADAIDAAARPFSGQTAPGSAINFGVPLFINGFEGEKLVIDVSGDGIKNAGANTALARNAALVVVDRINGIAIGGVFGLLDFYIDNIIGGPDSFAILATNFSDFGDAVERKLLAEIGGGVPGVPGVPAIPSIPEPGMLAMFGFGLAALGLMHRRRRQKAA